MPFPFSETFRGNLLEDVLNFCKLELKVSARILGGNQKEPVDPIA
jgi:hypothetical protein